MSVERIPFGGYDKEIELVINGVQVWVDYDDVDHDEAEGVSNLIASAPTLKAERDELRAALEESVAVLTGHSMSKAALISALEKARALLSRITP